MIAGDLRGRRLDVPAGKIVRPTSDRVREALFDILGGRVRGCMLLEIFAGSGAVGIEALSRGAALVVYIESGREALRVLEKNLETLGLRQRVSIVPAAWPEGLVRARSECAATRMDTPVRPELERVGGPALPRSSADAAGAAMEPRPPSPARTMHPSALVSPRGFDIVFADPPYSGAPYREILESLSAPGLVRDTALVVVEHEAHTIMPDRAGTLRRERIARYGRSALAFYVPDLPIS